MTVQSYFNFTNSLNQANDYLAKIQADFQTKYQYTILGQEDFVFADVAGPATGGDENFEALKGYRTTELVAQARVDASGASGDDKLKQKAVASLNFVTQSSATISSIILNAKPGSGDSTEIATAIGTLAEHLQDAVDDYATAVANGTVDAKKDAGFADVAKSARFAILQLSLKLQPLLASDNQIFNTNIYNLGTKLADIQSNLDKINAAASAAQGTTTAAASSASGTGSTVDVTV
jgi:hypothetical protein